MIQVNLGVAFAAGFASFISPCVLPLVPGYVSYMSGMSLEELARGADRSAIARRAGLGSIFFVLGFSIVFTALGATASAVGQSLEAHRGAFSMAAGIVVILFGLHTMGLLPIRWLYAEKRFGIGKLPPGLLGSMLMGMAFAFGWTPCIGPILAGILALAAQENSVGRGMLMLFAYSLGLGVPFILTGFGTGAFVRVFNRYKPYIRWGEIFAGALLVAVGGLIAADRMTAIIALMPSWLTRFAI